MDSDPATASPALHAAEGFRNLAENHRAGLEAVRERNRRRRLRYLLYLNLLVFAYLLSRARHAALLNAKHTCRSWGLRR